MPRLDDYGIDRDRYKVWAFPHPLIAFWILFPILWVNELLLGQRQPAVMLIDRRANGPLMERTFVPCPHCGSLNDGRLWSESRAFGNWFGLACPVCEQAIPLTSNIVTRLVLVVTYPLWKPVQARHGAAALSRQAARLRGVDLTALPKAGTKLWLRMGAGFGGIMGVFFVAQNLWAGAPLSVALLVGGLSGLVAGLFFGVFMGLVMSRRTQGAAGRSAP